MNTVVDPALRDAQVHEEAIAAACARFAPAWPLDQAIAVNPWWGWRDLPIERTDATLGALTGAQLRMPLAWYREQWRAGQMGLDDLRAVSASESEAAALAKMLDGQGEGPQPERVALICDLADRTRDLTHAMSWRAFVLQHISQQCAAYFDQHQAAWHPTSDAGLYASWRIFAGADRSPAALLGAHDVMSRLHAAPPNPDLAITQALQRLGFSGASASALEGYLTALLCSVQGWASVAAWQEWQVRLGTQAARCLYIRELLAIKLTWEAALAPLVTVPADWHLRWQMAALARLDCTAAATWKLQEAMEHAFYAPLAARLREAAARPLAAHEQPVPEVMAFFCIDVRSERMRRALEAAGGPRVRTGGFAGFFGLPVAHLPLGAHTATPQLPGLLAPQRTTEETVPGEASLGDALRRARRHAATWKAALQQLRSGPSSAFSYVEALGGLAAGKLLSRTLGTGLPSAQTSAAPRLVPRAGLTWQQEQAERRDLLAGILQGMGLADPALRWPAMVLVVGHGSQSANNPLAATLDCGACGGQTGEVNARVLASLLNDAELRELLAQAGIRIPPKTRFVAGVHWTTTDEVTLYDAKDVDADVQPLLLDLQHWLQAASAQVRAERAPSLGLATSSAAKLARRLVRRANDWSQLRPEWGLANNAGFIVAPRERTRTLDLQGRCFLHDYDWRTDAGFRVLESIMTAPMLVTNWINLQYFGSVVDPARWGGGNKTLHNVVGGRVGVFEGNGGDLRIGLSWQSVHDGVKFVHTPLRLSVFIEAPREAIDGVLDRHEVVRQLADHGWLLLHCVQPQGGGVLLREKGTWREDEAKSAHS
jgi:uncharacterized protein